MGANWEEGKGRHMQLNTTIVMLILNATLASAAEILPEALISGALRGEGANHYTVIMDTGRIMGHYTQLFGNYSTARVTLMMPEALIAQRSAGARRQYLNYDPAPEEIQNVLTVIAEGFTDHTVDAGCAAVSRVVLLSGERSPLVIEPISTAPVPAAWQIGEGVDACAMQAQFAMQDVLRVRASAPKGEFLVAVLSGPLRKIYKVKTKYQARLWR